MSVQEAKRIQHEAEVREDLTPHAGRWVALRDGHVVASGDELTELRANPEVQDDDVLVRVPRAPGGYFF